MLVIQFLFLKRPWHKQLKIRLLFFASRSEYSR